MTGKQNLDDESTLSEITIQPVGRIYVFGPSLGILEMLETLAPTDARLQNILTQVRHTTAVITSEET